jgi:hypothetical protein
VVEEKETRKSPSASSVLRVEEVKAGTIVYQKNEILGYHKIA